MGTDYRYTRLIRVTTRSTTSGCTSTALRTRSGFLQNPRGHDERAVGVRAEDSDAQQPIIRPPPPVAGGDDIVAASGDSCIGDGKLLLGPSQGAGPPDVRAHRHPSGRGLGHAVLQDALSGRHGCPALAVHPPGDRRTQPRALAPLDPPLPHGQLWLCSHYIEAWSNGPLLLSIVVFVLTPQPRTCSPSPNWTTT